MSCLAIQTTVLSLRICFRCSLTHDDSGRFDWLCRLRHILAGARVYLCCYQSAPDRIRVLRRPFCVIQPLSVDNLQALCPGFLQLDGFRQLQLLNDRKLSLNRSLDLKSLAVPSTLVLGVVTSSRLLVFWKAVMCSIYNNCRYLLLAICDPSTVSSDLIECLITSFLRLVFPDWRSHAVHPLHCNRVFPCSAPRLIVADVISGLLLPVLLAT